MNKVFLAALLIIGTTVKGQVKLDKADAAELSSRLEGNFDNEEQSHTDPAYYNIALHIKTFELRGRHTEGYWLYAEQSMAAHPAEPYRQRVYHIYKADKEHLACELYELPDPLRFAGAWYNPALLKKLTRDSLVALEGCGLTFTKDEQGSFYGRTAEKTCVNSLKGAAYATEDLTVYPNMLISRERGWDRDGKQVWGPDKDGYRFRKFTSPRKPKDD